MTSPSPSKQRTPTQNNSIHLYCELVAQALNDAGLTMRVVLEHYKMDVEWGKYSVKDAMWKTAQKRTLLKESTTQLDTKEVNEIYDMVNRFLTQELKMESIPFPHIPDEETKND